MSERIIVWVVAVLGLLCLGSVLGIVGITLVGREPPPSLAAIAGTAIGGIMGLLSPGSSPPLK